MATTLIQKLSVSTDVGIKKGKLVKGRLERGKDGIKRRYIEKPEQDEKYSTVIKTASGWEFQPPIYCPTP